VVSNAGQHIRSIQHTDYISRSNPEWRYDIQLIDQVNKAMLPGEEIFMFYHKNLKLMDSLKLKSL
jgi:cell division protein FtsA